MDQSAIDNTELPQRNSRKLGAAALVIAIAGLLAIALPSRGYLVGLAVGSIGIVVGAIAVLRRNGTWMAVAAILMGCAQYLSFLPEFTNRF
jgi:hypothetical protein